MEKILTREQLNTLDKSILIDMYLGMAAEMKALNSKMDILLEQLALANTRAFAAKTDWRISAKEK